MNPLKCFIPCCIILITGCNQTPSIIKVEDVESLTFYTTQRDFETPNGIREFEEFLEWNRDSLNGGMLCRDSVVNCKSAIKTFVQLVNSLKPSRNDSYDLRTVVAINFRHKKPRYIGFGEHWGTYYDGKVMLDDKRLFQYLEDSIYSKHTQSYWWGAWAQAVQSGCHSFVNDELTGVKAYTELNVDTPPLFNGKTNGFQQEFHRVSNIPRKDGDTTRRKVEVQFIISKKGELIGPRIRDKERDQLNEEEIQVIEAIAKIQNWAPGTNNGEPVDVFLNRFLTY